MKISLVHMYVDRGVYNKYMYHYYSVALYKLTSWDRWVDKIPYIDSFSKEDHTCRLQYFCNPKSLQDFAWAVDWSLTLCRRGNLRECLVGRWKQALSQGDSSASLEVGRLSRDF